MKTGIGTKLFAAAALFAASTGASVAGAGDHYYFKAELNGFNMLPSIYTHAYGKLITEIDPYGKYIYYKLYYENMSDKVTAAHIHFAQKYADGGPIAFLCGGPKPACPEYGGWVEGKIMASDIIGPAGQGIEPGDIKSAIMMMKKGLTYGNVHNDKFPKGELRGQLYPVDYDYGYSSGSGAATTGGSTAGGMGGGM